MDYWRDNDGVLPQTRVNRTAHDGAGRAIAQWDPRLFLDASAPANLQTTHALSGAVLCTSSVDAGMRVALLGEAGQQVHAWDGRGSQRWMQYDTQLRPESVFEQPLDGEALCTERLCYGASDQASAERNQCGQLIRHDDPAGSQRYTEFGLHGTALEQTRHFLNDLILPDWPESTADREWLLEPGEGATTRSQVNALGEVSRQTDAKGHRQLFSQTLDGQLREARLQLKGEPTPKALVSAIHYNAHGQTEREVAGNGVITTLEYDAQNGRLTRLSAQRGNEALQDLNYAYDPVGNVLSIEDAALPIRYFANQRIEPVNCYFYDSLSQLIEALGWEAGGANKGPQFSTFDDPAPRANYRQTYHYDLGGNLLELTHEGPQNHGHRLVAAAHSNRCLPVLEGVEPGEDDFRRGFDGNGNLLKLQPGQALAWDLRNQLGEVRPVVRDSGVNDRERYVYGADGMRLRKVRETLAHARTLVAETHYLPSLELRKYSGTGEVLQVISVQTGRSSVRVLHWESETPKDAANDQYRYHLNDHLGSCTLELDEDGEVISLERYHPYGTTAWFAGRGEVEASYRTVRYSGKERDATGLYYYGFRYYVAEWQRWLNTDPLGPVDGLNVYGMTLNNPIRFIDRVGTISEVPREINWIWLGGPLPVEAAMNINNVVDAVPDYSATLWVDSKAWSSGHGQALENLSRRVRIADVSDAFQGLSQKVYAAFERERSGPLKNYPAASDIARMAVLSKAGAYLDVDVQLAKSFPGLLNAPNGLLAYKRTNTTINNSALAAGEGSPVVSKALSSIANEYSSSTSSTWAKKRAYPGPAEVAAALEKRSDYLHGLEDEIAAMDLAILTNPSGVPHSLMFGLSSKQKELQAAQELELEDFLPSARVTETMRITGPGLIRSALGKPDGLISFEAGQFKPIDASGEAIFRKPPVLRRASIS
ncbi:UNVERIFIED_ORG: insecticidal toxin complex protein TccC [Pseudomonas reinekei]|nr:insecticidal toxin complex protein TccC [Pseudomonas reinekei]